MTEEKNFIPCPDNIVVVGGGRWARVFTEVLYGIVPPSVKISVHSPSNANSMSNWISEKRLKDKVDVSPNLLQFPSVKSHAVIVVNAARDHESSIDWAISAGIPVLVEKPVALTATAVRRLLESAIRQDILFCSAHVFLFAEYLYHFSNLVKNKGNIESLLIQWTDPKFENRYGEQKQYDTSLPIFNDILPHILSIIGILTPNQPVKFEITKFKKGGSGLEIKFMLQDIPCIVFLERNGDQRKRLIKANIGQEMLQLDFSKEPGLITDGYTTSIGDPQWDARQRPVAQMLTAYLKWVATGQSDDRLDAKIGLRACEVIDKISDLYRLEMKSWLVKRAHTAGTIDDDIMYALTEIVQSAGRLSPDEVNKQIKQVWQQFSNSDESQLPAMVDRYLHPVDLVRTWHAQNN